MWVEFEVNVDGAIKGIDDLVKDIQDADAKATRRVARTIVLPAVRQALSFPVTENTKAPIGRLGRRSGRTYDQIAVKVWKSKKDGLYNAAVKVRGDRAFIARFHEHGTQSHGRVPKQPTGKSRALPARKMFAITGAALKVVTESAMVSAFESEMKAKGYKK